MSKEVVITVDAIRKSFNARKKIVEAVKSISFDIYQNEIFALLGPNGSGKTTTIKMLLGLSLPDSGSVNILGNQIPKEVKKVLGNIGVILEGSRNLYWSMSVMENVYYFANMKGKEIAQVKEPMEIWAEKLNLANHLSTPVGRLSRGMQQKTGLICSLAIKPSILILDEPLLGLDIMTTFEMENIIRELKGSTTVILSSHNLRFIERVADRLAILKEGDIIAMGHASELKKNISLFQYRILLRKREAISGYLQDIQSIHTHSVKMKVTEVDNYTDIIELTLSKPELIFDIMETLKEYPVFPTEINTLGESFEEMFLSLVEEREQSEACI
mgnify:CR=1 FL=1